MAGADVTCATRAGEGFTGYLSAPASDAPAPGILLITAIFGIDEEMREIADGWAADGFIVSVPDIFWRVMPGPVAELEKGLARMEAFDQDQGMRDIEDLIADLRARPQCDGRIAMLGFCFGGLYAHLGAARLGVDAAGAFHGVAIGPQAGEAATVDCPVSFHFGDEDPVVPMDEVAAIREAYAGRPKAEITVHEGATHGFAMPRKEGYHPAAAAASREAVLRCFRSI